MGVEAALAAVAVSSLAAAGTAVYSGHQQASAAVDAAEAQAAQYAEEREAARVAATQAEAAKRREMTAVLSASDALRAGRGLDLMSGTGEAIRRETVEAGEADITTIRANDNRTGRRLGLAANTALTRGSNEASTALMTGYGRAISSLASGAADGASILRRPR
jgi:hypothetical protein